MIGLMGHIVSGTGAAVAWIIGQPVLALHISGMVMIRQTVSWLHKRDSVGKDMREHMTAFGLVLIAWGVLMWLARRHDRRQRR